MDLTSFLAQAALAKLKCDGVAAKHLLKIQEAMLIMVLARDRRQHCLKCHEVHVFLNVLDARNVYGLYK